MKAKAWLALILILFASVPLAHAFQITNDLTVTVSAVVPEPAQNSNNGASAGGGGGGGGSARSAVSALIPSLTGSAGVEFSGSAYPLSTVTLLENGAKVVTTEAGPDANFSINLSGLDAGNYTFSLYGQDSSGYTSTLFTVPVYVTKGATTDVGGIFIAPTIAADKSEVKQGDVITFFGQSIPQSSIDLYVHSNEIISTTTTDKNGVYRYAFDTSGLEEGDHTAMSRVFSDSLASSLSQSIGFTLGNEDVSAENPSQEDSTKALDFNGDGKVDLADFSIMAYWFGKPNPPAALTLDHSGVVDLVDLSILAFYWKP